MGTSAKHPGPRVRADQGKRAPPPRRTNPWRRWYRSVPKSFRVILAAAVVILVGSLVTATVVLKTQMAQLPATGRLADASLLTTPHAPTLGPSDARVHVVEFLDPACWVCAKMHEDVKRIVALHQGRVRLTVRHVAFHPSSSLAIRLLYAAQTQDLYWPALEALLQAQPTWARSTGSEPLFDSIRHLPLDRKLVEQLSHTPEAHANLRRDIEDARALGVARTPEFFVNGRLLARISPAALEDRVRDAVNIAY